MPTMAELETQLTHRIARISQLNAEYDALRDEFDRFIKDTEEAARHAVRAITQEALELTRLEDPTYALAYVLNAIARMPIAADDGFSNVDVRSGPDALTLRALREWSR
jgi:hypothetical protein